MKNVIGLGVSALVLLSSTALAATIDNVAKLSNNSQVNISGVVESVEGEREFILRDTSGNAVDVDVTSNQSLTLKEGDEVDVSGKVDKGLISTDINASDVRVKKGLVEGATDAVSSIPGVSTMDAQAFNIVDVPRSGIVKVTGIVSDVDSEKKFTLKDKTGSINIDMTSAERAVLTEGATVTVLGAVDSGIFSKDINATKVLVIADAKTSIK